MFKSRELGHGKRLDEAHSGVGKGEEKCEVCCAVTFFMPLKNARSVSGQ